MGVDSNKYNKSIPLLCPTCGGEMFEFSNGVDQAIEVAKCVVCKREIAKDDLIRENEENISEHVEEIKKEIIDDFRDYLKNSFKGNKYIRIK
ncbi:hypothetical protein [Thalassospira sp.]|uniref:ECs_2282 family putative zinc-binding protein n=1 Tax=Thalassospira sp. TaxID=1912094 RepID=UPI0027348B0A|nr:hypothetical protein [Thalassospira sp.]MDP2700413.1 hypothetical protein [Thalassospira sp.]